MEFPESVRQSSEKPLEQFKQKVQGVHFSAEFQWASCAKSDLSGEENTSKIVTPESDLKRLSACTIDPAFNLASGPMSRSKIGPALANKENIRPRGQIMVSRYNNIHRDSCCSAASGQSKAGKPPRQKLHQPAPVKPVNRLSSHSSSSQPVDRYGRLKFLEDWPSQQKGSQLSHNSPVRLESYSTQQLPQPQEVSTHERPTVEDNLDRLDSLNQRPSPQQGEPSNSFDYRRLTVNSESVGSNYLQRDFSSGTNRRDLPPLAQDQHKRDANHQNSIGNQTSRFEIGTPDILLPNCETTDERNSVDPHPKFTSLFLGGHLDLPSENRHSIPEEGKLLEPDITFPQEIEESFSSAYSKMPAIETNTPRPSNSQIPRALLIKDLSMMVKTDLANKAANLLGANRQEIQRAYEELESSLNSNLGCSKALDLVVNLRQSFEIRVANYSRLSNLLYLKRSPGLAQSDIVGVQTTQRTMVTPRL